MSRLSRSILRIRSSAEQVDPQRRSSFSGRRQHRRVKLDAGAIGNSDETIKDGNRGRSFDKTFVSNYRCERCSGLRQHIATAIGSGCERE